MPQEVVSISVPLFESLKGRYFVGQSGLLQFGNGRNAWCGLFNPRNSQVRLHVNVFTVTNLSASDFVAEIWFNPTLPGNRVRSNLVTAANRAICPQPRPQVELLFAEAVAGIPTGGVNAFDREIAPNTTVAQDEDGKYIIPAGESFVLFLVGQDTTALQASVAFGWWETEC